MSLHSNLHVEWAPGVTVVKVATRHLGEDQVQAVGQQLFGLVEHLGRSWLVLDMALVDFLSSTGLGKFVALNTRVRAGGGRLVLINVTDLVYEVFAVTCLDRILDVRKGPGDDFPLPTSVPLAS